jgi:hypothetical protein
MLGNRLALLAALALYCATLVLALTVARDACDGAYAYSSDDAYIHLGIARQLVEHRVWGIDSSGFASTSSSPGWTILLATLGAKLWSPLVCAAIGSVGVLVATGWALRDLPVKAQAIGLLAQVFLVPLAAMTVIGMEHTVHAALCIVALVLGSEMIFRPQDRTPLLVVLAIAGTIRYETLFLAFAIVSALALERRWKDAVAVFGAAVAGPLVYAIASLSRGWYAVPNTLILKSMLRASDEPISVGFVHSIDQLLIHPAVGVAIGLACLLGAGLDSGPARVRAQVFAIAALLHVLFARIGNHGRYEVYLIAMTIAVLAPAFAGSSSRTMMLTGGLLVSFPFLARTQEIEKGIVSDERVVCRDQLPMARFLASEFADGTVAVAEIGAVSWLSQERVIDLLGLGNMEVAKHIRAGTYNAAAVDKVAKDADVAVVFDSIGAAVPGFQIPSDWIDLGSLVDPDLAQHGSALHFYAPRADKVPRLADALGRFPALPPTELRRTNGFTYRGTDFDFTGGPAQATPSGGLGFYGNGRAQLREHVAGQVVLRLSGTPGGGRQPLLGVICGDTRYDVEAPEKPEDKTVCTLDGTGPLVLSYDDDFADGVQDRNVEVERVLVTFGSPDVKGPARRAPATPP